MSSKDLNLLIPEWQGYAEDTRPHANTLIAARDLYGYKPFLRIFPSLDKKPNNDGNVAELNAVIETHRSTKGVLAREAPSRIFMLAGTCGSEVAPISYLNELYLGRLAVLWFDAHGDLNTPETSTSKHFHGMALRTLLGEGPEPIAGEVALPLRTEQVFLIGGRDLDRAEACFVQTSSLYHCTCLDAGAVAAVLCSIKARGFDKVYVHVDLDCMNPGEFPHSLMQTSGGFAPRQVASAVNMLWRSLEVVGLSIVEFCAANINGPEELARFIAATGVSIGCSGEFR